MSNRNALNNTKLPVICLALMPLIWFATGIFSLKTARANERPLSASCSPGTKAIGVTNSLITNGYFSTLVGGSQPANTLLPGNWSSSVPYVGDDVYPPDTSVSIQIGRAQYFTPIVDQVPFPGDAALGIPGSETWLYSNGNNTGAPYIIWQEDITGLRANTTYIFYVYTSNVIGTNSGRNPEDPLIQFFINNKPQSPRFQVYDHFDPDSGDFGEDLWRRSAILYTTGASESSAKISVRDTQLDANGDDFGFVAVGFEPCRPNIGIAKSVNTPRENADGSYTVTYTVTLQNYAPKEDQYNANNLQVTDNLATTFANARINSVSSLSSSLQVNSNFNGSTDQNLLRGTDTLEGQQTATITFDVNFTPENGFLGPFNNSASVTGTHAASRTGLVLTDTSVDGADPDRGGIGNPINGDLDPSNNTSPTSFNLTANSLIGVAKAATTPRINNDGSFVVNYTIVVSNVGNTPLTNVQLTENLSQTFTGARDFNVEGTPTITGSLSALNSNFNGTSDTNLLAGTQTLAPGASATINLNVRVNPGTNPGPYTNTAIAVGTDPDNVPVTDESNNGISVDPDGDRNPKNNNEPTPVTLAPTPRLGVAKAVGTATNNSDRSFTVPYTITVSNVGNINLNNLLVTDNLSNTFRGAATFSVEPNSIRGNGLTVNPNFNGNADNNLLAGTDSLPVGESRTITFNVRVTPGDNSGPYNNNAIGNAVGANGTAVSDESTNGTNVDPDGDGDPQNNNSPTSVSFSNLNTPRLRLIKRITSATRNSATINFSDIEQDENANAINQAGLPPRGIRSIPPTTNFNSGDEVEYTIYFLSDGAAPVSNFSFCDLIPEGTTYIPNSIVVRLGNSQPTPGGRYLAPLSSGTVPRSCSNNRIPNGAVSLELNSLNNTPGSNFGFVRFRVKID